LTPSTQDNVSSAKTKPPRLDPDIATSGEQDLNALKRTLQEQRRAFTLMRAEADKERELREALEAQLLEANAEIVASWDRRKEMARVIGDQQAQLAEALKEAAALTRGIASLKQVVANREESMAKRDKVISGLKAQLQARYEELAALERHIVESTISGRAKRLARQARKLTKKGFQV
jgi:chromosome segregation ATPase